jgi:hypothetical protein
MFARRAGLALEGRAAAGDPGGVRSCSQGDWAENADYERQTAARGSTVGCAT